MAKFASGLDFHRDESAGPLPCTSIAAAGAMILTVATIRRLILTAALLGLLLVSFGQRAQAQFPDVIVFSAGSLREALADANNIFLFENGSGAVMTYGASAALAKQIESGAAADVFISDDIGSMDYLAERKLIMLDTRDKFLRNKLVLIAPAGSNVALTTGPNFPLAQALGAGRLAMADPAAAAAGKYGKAALESLGVWGSVADKVASAPDERAALALVSRGEAPLGIVYETDAAVDKNVKIVAAFPEGSHPPIVYSVAILANSTNGVSSIYVQYLLSPKATGFFEKRGFEAY